MPGTAEPTASVFISYRREGGFYLAKNIYDHLKGKKYDVFMDLHSLGAGDFESKTLAEIAARDYFVMVLTIGSMERMLNDGDWLRRELTAALDANRTIIPVLDVRFDFDVDDVRRTIAALPVSLRKVTSFNAVRMPPFEYFEDGLARLCKFLAPKADAPQVARSKSTELARAESLLRPYDAISTTKLTGVERKTLSWSDLQGKLLGTEPLQLNAPTLTANPLMGLSWTEVPGATKYVLEQSADRNFASPTVAFEGTKTSYMNILQRWVDARTTFYRVKAIGARVVSRDSKWSNVYEEKPPVVPRLDAPVLSTSLGMCTWTVVKGATKYVLEQSAHRSFALSTVAYEGARTSYLNLLDVRLLNRGLTYYRVKAISGRAASRDSEWSNICLEKPAVAPQLAAPVLKTTPFGGCNWTEVKGATKYVLEQSEHQNFASSTVAYEGTDTYYLDIAHFAKLGRPAGPAFYRVKAIGAGAIRRDSEWSNVVPVNRL